MAAPYSFNEHHFMEVTSSSLDMTVVTKAAPVGLTAMPGMGVEREGMEGL